MYTPEEIEAFSMIFDNAMRSLEIEVMEDVIRRIRINSGITRSADWQLYRLYELGKSKKSLRKAIKKAFKFDESSINQLYQDIISKGYARDETLYKAKGKQFIPFEKNETLQQYISAIAKQTLESMQNISQSLGFAVKSGDKRVFKPIAKYYQTTLDNAINGIATGVFDYNTVLKQTVSEMTNSGLRTVDYETGWSNRADVAARRAVMTGLTQVTAKINEHNAEKLGTDMFEVSWHSGARPSHQVWQGRWYKRSELESICGLGSVTGLCGANCYHSYYPVIPGVSVPTYTEEELDEMNRQENIPIDYNGKQYTKYEALQRQRQLETRMRAERQKIKLLQDGEADETDIMLARAKYRGTSQEYTSFSKAMDLPQQRQRVTVDGLGNIGVGKWKIPVDKVVRSGIIRDKRIVEGIENGEITKLLNSEKQKPHILGSDMYDPAKHKSYFIISEEELQSIINKYYGTGEVTINANGIANAKEYITVDKIIGRVVSSNGEDLGETDRFRIHYSKNRTHAVPTISKRR